MKKEYLSFSLIFHSEMARRERVLAEAAESRQRAGREVVKPSRKGNKETCGVRQTRGPFCMGSWTEERGGML